MSWSIGASQPDGMDIGASQTEAKFAPIITDQSPDTIVDELDLVSLFVTVIGVPAPTYQWKKDGSLLPGETNPTYTFTAGMSTMGVYTCTITNSQGYADTSDINIDLIGMLTYRMFNLQSDLDRT